MKGILGRKIGMSQLFTEEGILIPVTFIEATPNIVVQVKNKEKDGYNALKLGFEEKRKELVNKPDAGQFKKSKTTSKRFMKEFKNMTGYELGAKVDVSIFEAGDFIDAAAISKGKGFAGSIKRHNYSRGPMAHGSGYHRGVGSMGPIAPNRIMKSKLMPGHMGNVRKTIQNLEVVHVDIKNNILIIKGAVPGPKKQLIEIKNAVKKTKNPIPKKILNFSKVTVESPSENAEQNASN
ncbi:50S ribosomal protein L3 [Spiroplasma endosymbiont of Amphibalanus improvisus]|uniref:50S ribosomal protein L3 n=1 Tax=Spiroplasma endosymbiont of Amphibalanus improvisus TaxID=3066327 RepID=UPI00313C923F